MPELHRTSYVTVPRRPTPEMLKAAWPYALAEDAHGVWDAMLGAAPPPQQMDIGSFTVARDGAGEPCPDCGATNTLALPAVAAHSRCMHCGNSWEATGNNPPLQKFSY